ncbi:MAG: SH3 domain-containing protein [Myxococcales bacterium]
MRRAFIAVGLAVLLLPAGGAGEKQGDELTVNGLNVKLFSKPSFLSKSVATLDRGAVVKYEGEEERGFWQVSGPNDTRGWVQAKYLVAGRVRLTSLEGGESEYVAPEEYAHAARGFNKAVEEKLAADDEALAARLQEVDRIQAVTVDPEEALKFAAEGRLIAQAGGDQ